MWRAEPTLDAATVTYLSPEASLPLPSDDDDWGVLMKRLALAGDLLLLILLAACGGPSPTPSPSVSAVIGTADQAALIAERLTSIAGPWNVGDIAHGTYESLWGGSTSDLTGIGTADRAAKASRVVWRVDLSGPNGSEQLYIDEVSGQLLDAITQGT